MPKAAVQLSNFFRAHGTRAVLDKPLPESVIQSLVFASSDFASALDGGFVGAQGNVAHWYSVHHFSVSWLG